MRALSAPPAANDFFSQLHELVTKRKTLRNLKLPDTFAKIFDAQAGLGVCHQWGLGLTEEIRGEREEDFRCRQNLEDSPIFFLIFLR